MGRAEENKGKRGGEPNTSYVAWIKVAFFRVILLSSLFKH